MVSNVTGDTGLWLPHVRAGQAERGPWMLGSVPQESGGRPPPRRTPQAPGGQFQSPGGLIHSALRSGVTAGNRPHRSALGCTELHCAFPRLRSEATDCSASGSRSWRPAGCGRAAGSRANWRRGGLGGTGWDVAGPPPEPPQPETRTWGLQVLSAAAEQEHRAPALGSVPAFRRT